MQVPNTYSGLEMASLGVQLEVPETEVLVKSLSGMDIKVGRLANIQTQQAMMKQRIISQTKLKLKVL